MAELRPTAKAIITAAVSTGAMLFVASTILEWWDWRDFLTSTGLDPATAIIDPPRPTGAEAVVFRIIEFTWLCLLGAAWAALIAVPAIVSTRRLLGSRWGSRLLAFVLVGSLAAVAYSYQWSPGGPWSPILIFGIGGSIGLVSVAIVEALLPSNKSLERTREG